MSQNRPAIIGLDELIELSDPLKSDEASDMQNDNGSKDGTVNLSKLSISDYPKLEKVHSAIDMMLRKKESDETHPYLRLSKEFQHIMRYSINLSKGTDDQGKLILKLLSGDFFQFFDRRYGNSYFFSTDISTELGIRRSQPNNPVLLETLIKLIPEFENCRQFNTKSYNFRTNPYLYVLSFPRNERPFI